MQITSCENIVEQQYEATTFHLYSYTEQLNTIPIVITLVTKDGATEQLRVRVQQQLAALSEQININISLIEVNRFGMSICII